VFRLKCSGLLAAGLAVFGTCCAAVDTSKLPTSEVHAYWVSDEKVDIGFGETIDGVWHADYMTEADLLAGLRRFGMPPDLAKITFSKGYHFRLTPGQARARAEEKADKFLAAGCERVVVRLATSGFSSFGDGYFYDSATDSSSSDSKEK
jgi:hypothetical protein